MAKEKGYFDVSDFYRQKGLKRTSLALTKKASDWLKDLASAHKSNSGEIVCSFVELCSENEQFMNALIEHLKKKHIQKLQNKVDSLNDKIDDLSK